MKVFHCADVHLCSALASYGDPVKISMRNSEILADFINAFDMADKEGASLFLISGDLFDTAEADPSVIMNLKSAMKQHPSVSFVLLSGNHDRHVTEYFENDKPDNLYLLGETWTSYDFGGVTVSGIEMGENFISGISKASLDREKINIVMLHGTVIDDRSAGSLKAFDDENISGSLLSDLSIDYLALGHIHEHREGRLFRGIQYVYPGCFEGRGFDEGGPHGVEVLDIDCETRTINMEFRPMASRNVFIKDVDISGKKTCIDIIDTIKDALASDTDICSDDYVRVLLTGSVDMDSDRNTDLIRKSLESSYYAFSVKDNTTIAVDYHQFQNDKSLKGQYIRDILSDTSLSEKEKGEAIYIGLRALEAKKKEDISL